MPMAVSALTGEDDVTAGIAVDEACLFPDGGKAVEEVQFELRQFVEVVRLEGDALHGGLHDESRGEFEDVGGLSGVTALVVLRDVLVEDDAAPVHRGCGIAAEGVEGEVEAFSHAVQSR